MFSFGRMWAASRTTLHFLVDQLCLANVTYLVTDEDLASDKLLLGMPVLQNLQVETRTSLESMRAVLDGADCFTVGSPTIHGRSGQVSRLLTALMDNERPSAKFELCVLPENQPRVVYDEARAENDAFPSPSLLAPIDGVQHEDAQEAVEGML